MEITCPECGEPAGDDTIVKERLSDLEYLHTDVTHECPNGHTWKQGIPEGQTESEMWICPSCGGDFMPHFIHAYTDKQLLHVRPKCIDCKHIPDEPLKIKGTSTHEYQSRFLLGHHLTTGKQEKLDDN